MKKYHLVIEDGKEANNSRAKLCNLWISRLALIQNKTGVSKLVRVCEGVCVCECVCVCVCMWRARIQFLFCFVLLEPVSSHNYSTMPSLQNKVASENTQVNGPDPVNKALFEKQVADQTQACIF